MRFLSYLHASILPHKNVKLRTLSIMPMDRPSVQATRNQRLSKAKARNRDLTESSNKFFYFQIIGNASRGNPGTVMVSSENQSYLFNCSEGLQRLACENKSIKLTKIQNIFVTSLDWAQISGVFGLSLTLHDIGLPKLCLHGPEGIGSLFTSIAGFVDQSQASLTSWSLTTRTPDQGDFIDSGLKMKYVQIQPSSHSQDNLVNQCKRLKTDKISLAYIGKAPDTVGTLDIAKCKQLKIPIGPKLGMLKSGQDITLDDGRLIKSMDVVEKTKPGPLFVVLECPSISYIDSLMSNSDIEEAASMRNSDTTGEVSFVIHYCPNNVLQDQRYISWMKKFPSDCKHIAMNDSNSPVNFLALHRMQTQLNLLDPQIFPRLAEDLNTDSENISPPDDLNFVIRPRHLDRHRVKPSADLESSDIIIDRNLYRGEAFKIRDFNANLESLHKLHEKMGVEGSQREEPELVFFGTGSSMPSKYRNCSCIYLRMSNEDRMLMDCGEGSFGQMFRFFGNTIGDVLSTLRFVFISHYHADHHLGLIEILRQKRMYTDEPLLIVGPPQIKAWLEHFCRTFEDLSAHYRFYLSHVFESIDQARTTSKKLLDYSLKNKDRWVAPRSPQAIDRTVAQDSLSKQEFLDRLPIMDDIQLIKVRHCSNSYAIFFHVNLPTGNTYSIAYSGDAMPSNEFITRAQGCDLLIHEATLSDDLDSDARMKRHSTFSQAIGVGKQMSAKFILLTHFSQRYAKVPLFTEKFDDNVGFTFDNMRLRLPSDLNRIPILKSTLNTLFYEEVAALQDTRERAKLKQELISKYLEEHQSTSKLNAKEVSQRVQDEIERSLSNKT